MVLTHIDHVNLWNTSYTDFWKWNSIFDQFNFISGSWVYGHGNIRFTMYWVYGTDKLQQRAKLFTLQSCWGSVFWNCEQISLHMQINWHEWNMSGRPEHYSAVNELKFHPKNPFMEANKYHEIVLRDLMLHFFLKTKAGCWHQIVLKTSQGNYFSLSRDFAKGILYTICRPL